MADPLISHQPSAIKSVHWAFSALAFCWMTPTRTRKRTTGRSASSTSRARADSPVRPMRRRSLAESGPWKTSRGGLAEGLAVLARAELGEPDGREVEPDLRPPVRPRRRLWPSAAPPGPLHHGSPLPPTAATAAPSGKARNISGSPNSSAFNFLASSVTRWIDVPSAPLAWSRATLSRSSGLSFLAIASRSAASTFGRVLHPDAEEDDVGPALVVGLGAGGLAPMAMQAS